MVHYGPELCMASSLCAACNMPHNVYIPPWICCSWRGLVIKIYWFSTTAALIILTVGEASERRGIGWRQKKNILSHLHGTHECIKAQWYWQRKPLIAMWLWELWKLRLLSGINGYARWTVIVGIHEVRGVMAEVSFTGIHGRKYFFF